MIAYNALLVNAVMANTWWHLAAEKQKTYKGKILFSITGYGGGTNAHLIDMEFNGLDDSPWLYDAVNDYISGMHPMGLKKERECGVYLFEGEIKNYLPKGKVKLIYRLCTPS